MSFYVGSQVMCMSENTILTQCFDREELSDKKRPDTVRYRTVHVSSSCPQVSSLCFPNFYKSRSHDPNILSHNKTNSGVFPPSSVEWAV